MACVRPGQAATANPQPNNPTLCHAAPVQRSQRPHCDCRFLHHQLPRARGEGAPVPWHQSPSQALHAERQPAEPRPLHARSSLFSLPCLPIVSSPRRAAVAVQVIHEQLGIQHGCITTIHDVTNTQVQLV